MNSSLSFHYKSVVHPGAVYKIKIFQNGQITIPGAKNQFMFSELQYIVAKVISIYKRIFRTDDVHLGRHYHGLRNYTAQLYDVEALDICSLLRTYNPRDELVRICADYGLKLIDISTQQTRLIAQMKFQIDRVITNLEHNNPTSTSNRRQIKSITVQVTRKGVLLISGSTSIFATTHRVLTAVDELFARILPAFVQ
jgi:hypothetical protein